MTGALIPISVLNLEDYICNFSKQEKSEYNKVIRTFRDKNIRNELNLI